MTTASFRPSPLKTQWRRPACPIDRIFPGDVIAGRPRQMADEFALRSPVSFTERVKRVQLAEIMRGTVAESSRVEPGEVVFLRELLEYRSGGAGDVSVMGEPVSAFADVDGSQLPGPLVHVAEKIAVYRLRVREIETAAQRRLRKLVRADRHKIGFGLFEGGPIGYIETVFQDAGCRVEIRVTVGVARHSVRGGKRCG